MMRNAANATKLTMLLVIKFHDADGDRMAIIDDYEDGTLSLSAAHAPDSPFMSVGPAQAASMWPIFKHYAEAGTLAGYVAPGVDDADR